MTENHALKVCEYLVAIKILKIYISVKIFKRKSETKILANKWITCIFILFIYLTEICDLFYWLWIDKINWRKYGNVIKYSLYKKFNNYFVFWLSIISFSMYIKILMSYISWLCCMKYLLSYFNISMKLCINICVSLKNKQFFRDFPRYQ